MMFGFKFSFGVFFGSNSSKQQDANNVGETLRGNSTPEAVDRPHESVHRRHKQREILADRESLYILETATAANSERAKKLDRESLSVLMSVTKHLKPSWNSIGKSLNAPYHVAASTAGVSNGMLSFESPSSFTLRSCGISDGKLRPISEEDNIFATGITASKAAAAVARKISWEKLTAKLIAAGWSPSSIEALHNTQAHHPKDQVDSVYEWFDELEKRDAAHEREGLEASGSPITNPVSTGSRRQYHPVEKVLCKEKEETDKGYGEGLKSVPHMSIEKNIGEEKDSGKVELADGEEWKDVDECA